MASGRTPDWDRVRFVFEECVELEGDERAARLAELCAGDPELLAEVESLLRADVETSELRTRLPVEELGRMLAAEPAVGERIGKFTLREKLAEGGMGTVFLADQSEPARTVALKVLKGTIGVVDARRRFAFEVEALARMRHPGIAQIFEAGIHDAPDGSTHPWFAMEFVDGAQELERWCEQHDRDVEAVLSLFLMVCDAVQHGHDRGIVHRDLKPGNLLVGSDGRPMVIDFGIARSVVADLAEVTRMTTEGSVLGTLQYMSPEQIEGRIADLDVRTDVYSLGVVLFQMLTGDLPRSLTGVALADLVHAVRRVPARRLRDVRAGLPVDLDCVVGKALAYDAADRYASVEAFADDVRCVLECEPVAAKPPTTRRRVLLLIRRHRSVVAAVCLVVATLVTGALWTRSAAAAARRAASAATEAEWAARDAERRSREAAREVLDLAASVELRELEKRADAAWPAGIERLPELRAILADGRQLAARLPQLEAALAALNATAGPLDEVVEGQMRANDARCRTLENARAYAESMRQRLERSRANGDPRPVIEGFAEYHVGPAEERVRFWERLVPERLQVEFESTDERSAVLATWQHSLLNHLVTDLRRYAGGRLTWNGEPVPSGKLLPDVQMRVAWIEDVARRSIGSDDARRAWARFDAAFEPQRATYGSIEPGPRFGLLPIGRDPASGLFEFADLRTGEPPARRADGTLELHDESGLVFVLLPGGVVGGADGVVHVEPFLISKFEMTRGQWLRFCGSDPRAKQIGWPVGSGKFSSLLSPVSYASADLAEETLSRLGFELPTESRWEYACRAGTDTAWCCGDDPTALARHANLCDLSYAPQATGRRNQSEPWDDGFVYAAPVGAFAPNGFGLYDVHGNVAEWCRADDDQESVRICGGSYREFAVDARSSVRKSYDPAARHKTVGVRPSIALSRGEGR